MFKSTTSRIAINFRSFIHFLDRQSIVNQRDIAYLQEACHTLEDDLCRTTKINRIMEEYTAFVHETYVDADYIPDEPSWDEYEVYKVSRRRVLRLRKLTDVEGEFLVDHFPK